MARRKNTLKCTTDGSRIPAPPHARARATGLWWSTPTAGKCEPGAARLGGRAVAAGGASCTWRILDERERPRKIVNASCVDRHVWRVVRERAPACFSACGSPPPPAWPAPLKPHTDCELHCFYSTMCDTRPCPSPLASSAGRSDAEITDSGSFSPCLDHCESGHTLLFSAKFR